jgi:hypothetical protein
MLRANQPPGPFHEREFVCQAAFEQHTDAGMPQHIGRRYQTDVARHLQVRQEWAGSICSVLLAASGPAGFRNGPAVTGSAKVIIASLSFRDFNCPQGT